jgi:2,4-dienoyl-CoA reductase-like NADH-dependent reductase (Old Yellow Enzyme family)
MAGYYVEYARGGFGLVITEATYVDEAYSQGFWRQPGIANPRHRDAWRPLVEAVHAAGAPASTGWRSTAQTATSSTSS